MKKLFGGIDLNWKKLIIFAIVAGVYTGLINQVPFLLDTSFRDIAIQFECWILFGIIIIMNSKSNLDSGLKCFVFFLISQPIVYLVEVPFLGWSIMRYYRLWIVWTILCFPMGFIGYYMKKDKWWGLLILVPMLIFLGDHAYGYLGSTIFSFPKHLLSYLFCAITIIIYPLCIFNNKKIKIAGGIIGALIVIIFSALALIDSQVYETEIMCSGEAVTFDNTYKAYLKDSSYGELSIIEVPSIETYCIHSKFKKAGNTEFIIESPAGDKINYEIKIQRSSYMIKRLAD